MRIAVRARQDEATVGRALRALDERRRAAVADLSELFRVQTDLVRICQNLTKFFLVPFCSWPTSPPH